jgi:hypothetical protein
MSGALTGVTGKNVVSVVSMTHAAGDLYLLSPTDRILQSPCSFFPGSRLSNMLLRAHISFRCGTAWYVALSEDAAQDGTSFKGAVTSDCTTICSGSSCDGATVTPCALQLNIETHFPVIRGVRVDELMKEDAGRVPLPGPPESAHEPNVHDTPLLLIITISTTKHKLIACLEVRLRPFLSHEKSSLETQHIRGKSVPGSCGIAAQPRLSVINISSILLFDLFDSEPTNQPTVSHRISVNQSTNRESKILIGLVLFNSKRGRRILR